MRSDLHYNPFDPDQLDGYWEEVDRLRQECPVAKHDTFGGIWVVAPYKDVLRIYQDWETFSTELGSALPPMKMDILPVDAQPPFHTALRRLLNPFFSPPVVARQEPAIRSNITTLIDEFVEDGHCDLVEQFTSEFPGRVFFELVLGIEDPDELDACQRWVNMLATGKGQAVEEVQKAANDLRSWVHTFIERRRTEAPRGDVVDALIRNDLEDVGDFRGRPLTDYEITATTFMLVGAAIDSTGKATANALVHLAQRPALRDHLHDHPDAIPVAIEEFLRFEPVNPSLSRYVTTDVELSGEQIKAGERVAFLLGAANRDPEVFDDPIELDITRAPNRHLTFGAGPHRCLGSNLARLEIRVALEEILGRLHDLRLNGEVRYAMGTLRGAQHLPVQFTPGERLGSTVKKAS